MPTRPLQRARVSHSMLRGLLNASPSTAQRGCVYMSSWRQPTTKSSLNVLILWASAGLRLSALAHKGMCPLCNDLSGSACARPLGLETSYPRCCALRLELQPFERLSTMSDWPCDIAACRRNAAGHGGTCWYCGGHYCTDHAFEAEFHACKGKGLGIDTERPQSRLVEHRVSR